MKASHFKAIWILGLLVFAMSAFISTNFFKIAGSKDSTDPASSIAEGVEEHVSDGGEVGDLVPMEGDAGELELHELSIGSIIPVEVTAATKTEMVSFILNYLGYIPFADKGRFYGTGYFKSPDGVDNRNQEPVGVDSLGYVIWVYRNIFGTCPVEFEEPEKWPVIWSPVTTQELEIGDIGVHQDTSNNQNHFGLFVGYSSGFPVFVHCSGLAAPGYPGGNDRLSFLKSATTSFYMGNAPVDFHYFYRPDVEWKDLRETK